MIEKLLEFKLAYEVFGIVLTWVMGVLFILYLLIELVAGMKGNKHGD